MTGASLKLKTDGENSEHFPESKGGAQHGDTISKKCLSCEIIVSNIAQTI